MILENITLTNFRCFYGEVRIEFSTDPEKNVTLIYAENGVGKTTLLNSLLWCFYGETTGRFEQGSELVNFDAVKNGKAQAVVEVEFEHDSKRYVAKRYAGKNIVREFVVARIEKGNHTLLDAPTTFINTVLPKDMAPHFLFDGEYAEVFMAEENKQGVKRAVRDILGCSLVEAAIDDLSDVSKYFARNIPRSVGTDEATSLSNTQEGFQKQIEQAHTSLDELRELKESKNQQIASIDKSLLNSAGAKQLQTSRRTHEKSLRDAEVNASNKKKLAYAWLGSNGRFAVAKRIIDEVAFIDDFDNRGELPSPYNEEFITSILEKEECVCGTPILAGSEEAKNVASRLEKSASQTMRSRLNGIRATVSELTREQPKSSTRLSNSEKALADARGQVSRFEGLLGEVSEQLKEIDVDDIRKKEEKRESLKAEVSEIDEKIGAIKTNISTSTREIARLEVEISKIAGNNEEASLYRKRKNLADSLRSILLEQLEKDEKDARAVIRASIRKILESTSRKQFNLQMTESYEIAFVDSEGKKLPKSTGENQLLGMSFTAAIVEYAKIRARAKHPSLLPGTVAPLALDSPFGDLDPDYQQTTAEHIPKMAQQVILMVSKSQASKAVMEGLGDAIGAEYALIRHNKEPLGLRNVETRTYNGKDYQTSYFDQDFDGTSIEEIYRYAN